jgi:hypothetical protein
MTTTAKFKAGDRVLRIGVSCCLYGIEHGKEYVVAEVLSSGGLCIEGVKGVWFSANFTLAKAAPPGELTDQELADEFRANYLRNREIKVIMSARGFTQQYRKPKTTTWHDSRTQSEPDDLRFRRVVTVDPITTIV